MLDKQTGLLGDDELLTVDFKIFCSFSKPQYNLVALISLWQLFDYDADNRLLTLKQVKNIFGLT